MLTLALVSAAAVVSIWIAYPALVAVFAVFRRKQGSRLLELDETRRVSVILATRESDQAIRERVADVWRSDYPSELLEIVIAVDCTRAGDGADPPDLGRAVRVVCGDQPGGKAATLNAAVREASGEILVFTDTAQRFAPSAIPRLVSSFRDRELGIVSGALQLGNRERPQSLSEWYWFFERWLRANEARVHSAVGVTGAIYAMPRTLWRSLPPGLILDDVYTPMRLVLDGKRVGFREDAIAVDERKASPQREYARKVRTLTGVVQLCAWLPGILLPIRNPIWLQFVFHKLLRLLTPYLLILCFVGLVSWLSLEIDRTRPGATVAVLGAVSLALVLLAVASRRLRDVLMTAVAMQLAVVRATISGLRGHWDVWSP